MTAKIPTQAEIPGLPPEHVKAAHCDLCGAELPWRDPSMPGQKQRWCIVPLGGERSSCQAIAHALKRLEKEFPPDRAELRKLKQRQRDRQRSGKHLSAKDAARMAELLAEVGPEYPEAVRRGTRARLLRLANRFNSNGWGAA